VGFIVLGLLVSLGPWLVRNLLITGDPFYPFLTTLFHATPLFPWHVYGHDRYNLLLTGWQGFWIYLRNFLMISPVGHEGNAAIWWGPSAVLCFSGFLVLNKMFSSETRWVSGIAIASWIFSLVFVLKPPHHVGPIIFVMCCSFGFVLHKVLEIYRYKWINYLIMIFASLNFIKYLLSGDIKNQIAFCIALVLSGSPIWSFVPDMQMEPSNYASAREMNWVHYLINKYSEKDDSVIFMGSVRSAGIKRKHYTAFSLAKQPILYFAEKTKDGLELRDHLLSLGVKHIVFDENAWLDWVSHRTPDGKHTIDINERDMQKISDFFYKYTIIRFSVPSKKLVWLEIIKDPNEEFKPIPIKKEDMYKFIYGYHNIDRSLLRKTD